MEQQNERVVREIDLGTGSGIERFEGATEAEVLDKIVEAKKHATVKIREQEEIIRDLRQNARQYEEQQQEQQVPQYQGLSDEERNALSARLGFPVEALVEGVYGIPATELRGAVQAIQKLEQDRVNYSHTQRFLDNHSTEVEGGAQDYYPSKKNRQLIEGYIRDRGLPWHYGSISEAFDYIKTSGLLESPVDDGSESVPAAPRKQTPIGISARTGTGSAQKPGRVAAEADLYGMTSSQLEEWITNQEALGGRR